MGSWSSNSGGGMPTSNVTEFTHEKTTCYFTDVSRILHCKEYEGYFIVRASICFEKMTLYRHSFVILKCQKEGVAGFLKC